MREDPGGRSPLVEAAVKGRSEAVTALLSRGADPNEVDGGNLRWWRPEQSGRLPLPAGASVEDPVAAEATVTIAPPPL
eukprot:1194311-Prorocentrum_minimum.AAC.1